jgi:outer membrane protein OmpA-like peptidoglycan-associated protein
MKKYLIVLIVLLLSPSLKAQSYLGFLTDNYSGVHGVISNPANIVDSRYKFDINLGSASVFGENDYYGFPLFETFKSTYDFGVDATTTPTDNNNFVTNIDVLGPSIMFNISPTQSIAVFSRLRMFGNIHEINGTLFDNFSNEFDQNEDFLVDEGDFYGAMNGWAEIGVSYARILLDDGTNFIKGGLSAKYLQGMGNVFVNGNDVLIDYDADGTVISPGNTTGSIDSAGEFNFGQTENLEGDFANLGLVKDASGIGFDIGFVYEWRPDNGASTAKYENKYKLKIGVSVTDFGEIAYKMGSQSIFDLNEVNINEEDYNNAEDFEAALKAIYTFREVDAELNPRLPAAAHLTIDYALSNKVFLNLSGDYSLVKSATLNSSSIASNVFMTPRFESKWISFYMPVGMKEYSGFSWGAGLRAGPLFVGSGSVLSNLMKDDAQAADFYMGLKVPFFHSKPKDKDGDGIVNKEDDCPDVPGPKENKGCPWPDTDKDGIIDREDRCPEEFGDKLNQGCPIIDTDLDGVWDENDECPNTPGFKENNGCLWPDADNDSVPDKDDECPDTAGTIANKGCPEIEEEVVTEAVIIQLNEYGKTIMFAPDKASFKNESYSILKEMQKVLLQYPTARFRLEGHTDSRGTEKDNLALSKKRANAVRDYLVKNGIEASRLEAVGLGERYPVASNMYIPGRAQNRRVEVKLIK